MQLKVSNPVTFYIKFNGTIPNAFVVYDEFGKVYFHRYLNGRTPRIKFNMPDTGVFTSNNDFDIVKEVQIELPDRLPTLPPAQRDRWKDVEIVFNPNFTDGPVRIFSHTGIIETGPSFYALPYPIQVFVMEHEKAHMFYRDEEKCDLFAFVNFMRMGYNRSTAYYALSEVLRRTPANIERIREMFNHIQKTQKEKL
jgi:hypothetical protein